MPRKIYPLPFLLVLLELVYHRYEALQIIYSVRHILNFVLQIEHV